MWGTGREMSEIRGVARMKLWGGELEVKNAVRMYGAFYFCLLC